MSDAQVASQMMRGVVADPTKPGILALREVNRPSPTPDQVLVRVRAISLNAGDTRSALAAEALYVPGWDFSGVIEVAAADGSSPPVGTRVFGLTPQGAWAQYVCVRSPLIFPLPDNVSFEQAAALPVASVTALKSLRIGGNLKGKRVLITGASGGVGRYACQIASKAGAKLHAISRRAGIAEKLKDDGVGEVVIFPDMAAAAAAGDYDFILESVGGDSLGRALGALATDGICVNCGNSANAETCFNVRDFYMKDGTQLHGLYLGRVLVGDARPWLAEVAQMVSEGALKTPIGAEASWSEIADAAVRLAGQAIDGKIILHVD